LYRGALAVDHSGSRIWRIQKPDADTFGLQVKSYWSGAWHSEYPSVTAAHVVRLLSYSVDGLWIVTYDRFSGRQQRMITLDHKARTSVTDLKCFDF
jgi:hypothetical protein